MSRRTYPRNNPYHADHDATYWVVQCSPEFKDRILGLMTDEERSEWAIALLGGDLQENVFIAKKVLESKGVDCSGGLELVATERDSSRGDQFDCYVKVRSA